jgi:hypothetical protein
MPQKRRRNQPFPRRLHIIVVSRWATRVFAAFFSTEFDVEARLSG